MCSDVEMINLEVESLLPAQSPRPARFTAKALVAVGLVVGVALCLIQCPEIQPMTAGFLMGLDEIAKRGGKRTIIRGFDAAACSFPSTVALVTKSQPGGGACTGTLLTKNKVITAAHCGELVAAAVGLSILDAKQQDRLIKFVKTESFEKEDETGKNGNYDIEIGTLATDVELGDCVKTAELAKEPVQPGKKCRIAGWGWYCGKNIDSNSPFTVADFSSTLQEGSMTITTCPSEYSPDLTVALCTKQEPQLTAGGDSGSALWCEGSDGVERIQGILHGLRSNPPLSEDFLKSKALCSSETQSQGIHSIWADVLNKDNAQFIATQIE